jgi:AcrR family transcriptional regulator
VVQVVSDVSVRKNPRGRGRPSTLDESRVLDAAVTAFWRDGFAATDLDAVAAAAGTTKPSLYRRFDSKEGLFLAALERYARGHGSRPVAAFLAEPDIAAAVRAFFRQAVEGQTDPGLPTGCLFACAAAPLAESRPDIGAFLARSLDAASVALAERFEAAVADGALCPGFPSQARARLMLDAMQGLALRARSAADRQTLLTEAEAYADAILGG